MTNFFSEFRSTIVEKRRKIPFSYKKNQITYIFNDKTFIKKTNLKFYGKFNRLTAKSIIRGTN